MDEVKVEKGIPLPPIERGRPVKWPFATMEIGESFFMKGCTKSSVATACNQKGRKFGRKFAMRAGDGGYRVWRVA